MSRFGLTYACDDVRTAQSELETLLAQAQAARLLTTHWFVANEGHPTAVAAQSLFDHVRDDNLVIAGDEACTQIAGQLRQASSSLRALLAYNKIEDVAFAPPTDSPYTTPDTLDKLKPLFIGAAVIAGVVVLVPVITELVGLSRTARKLSGSRR
jgi:hypothetical protein